MEWVLEVDENGTINIPKNLLENVGWGEGDVLRCIGHEDGSFELRKVDES
jgi:AbrB family looped-hinge helix DNA binding protein